MYQIVCKLDDIIPNAGVAALIGEEQVAIFRIQEATGENVYAISNYDPFSNANVLSRGLVGSLQGKTVVASPIYKQHFCLLTGQCLEDENVSLKSWAVKIENGEVLLGESASVAA